MCMMAEKCHCTANLKRKNHCDANKKVTTLLPTDRKKDEEERRKKELKLKYQCCYVTVLFSVFPIYIIFSELQTCCCVIQL